MKAIVAICVSNADYEEYNLHHISDITQYARIFVFISHVAKLGVDNHSAAVFPSSRIKKESPTMRQGILLCHSIAPIFFRFSLRFSLILACMAALSSVVLALANSRLSWLISRYTPISSALLRHSAILRRTS